jgi:hypothetical protein
LDIAKAELSASLYQRFSADEFLFYAPDKVKEVKSMIASTLPTRYKTREGGTLNLFKMNQLIIQYCRKKDYELPADMKEEILDARSKRNIIDNQITK